MYNCNMCVYIINALLVTISIGRQLGGGAIAVSVSLQLGLVGGVKATCLLAQYLHLLLWRLIRDG